MEQLVEQLKRQIIESLNLEGVTPDKIDADAPLFGKGLGLDSIDALEIVIIVEKYYGIRITDLEVGRQVFHSVNSLAKFITENKGKQQQCPRPS